MNNERKLVRIHILLHEDAKHSQNEHRELQKTQVKNMKALLAQDAVQASFLAFLRKDLSVISGRPDASVGTAPDVTAVTFPVIQVADDLLTAKGIWLAETVDGSKAVAAHFICEKGQWKVWKLNLNPVVADIPESYEKYLPELEPETPAVIAGSPGGPAPGGRPPAGPGVPGGPGGAPFAPDAREEIFNMESDFKRLSKDIIMLREKAFPTVAVEVAAANDLMEQVKAANLPAALLGRMSVSVWD